MESTSRDRDDDVEVDAGEKREVCTCWVGDVFDGFMFKNEKFAETRDRTRDLMIFSHTLSRLSYLGF